MYNVKGPSKIVAKTTRRGIPQNIDNHRDHSKTKDIEAIHENEVNGPKPVFTNSKRMIAFSRAEKEVVSPQHEEVINFIHDSWLTVCAELEQETALSDGSISPRSDHSTIYYEDEPCPVLEDFKPFDLETWWGSRLYNYITNSVSLQN